jgi:putative membrane protein
VLTLAETMIDEHGQLGLEMEQLAQNKKLDASLQMTEESLALIDKIALLSERDFDRSFAEQNRRDHEQHLQMFERCAACEQDRDIKALAEKGQKMFSKHLQMAKDLERKIAA